FTKAGAVVFGSGLAIVPFLYDGVVNKFHWLNEHQFLDAVAVAMITPGPVVITVGFIGYLVAGPLGATLAALGVFLPCYLLAVVGLLVPLPNQYRGPWLMKLLDLGHLPLFAVVTVCFWWLGGRRTWLAFGLASLLAVAAEVAQPFTGRSGEVLDVIRGMLGAL